MTDLQSWWRSALNDLDRGILPRQDTDNADYVIFEPPGGRYRVKNCPDRLERFGKQMLAALKPVRTPLLRNPSMRRTIKTADALIARMLLEQEFENVAQMAILRGRPILFGWIDEQVEPLVLSRWLTVADDQRSAKFHAASGYRQRKITDKGNILKEWLVIALHNGHTVVSGYHNSVDAIRDAEHAIRIHIHQARIPPHNALYGKPDSSGWNDQKLKCSQEKFATHWFKEMGFPDFDYHNWHDAWAGASKP
ncbi:hypothetical protein ACQZV8_13375 [Magnetococcales bacterium HHB-1]